METKMKKGRNNLTSGTTFKKKAGITPGLQEGIAGATKSQKDVYVEKLKSTRDKETQKLVDAVIQNFYLAPGRNDHSILIAVEMTNHEPPDKWDAQICEVLPIAMDPLILEAIARVSTHKLIKARALKRLTELANDYARDYLPYPNEGWSLLAEVSTLYKLVLDISSELKLAFLEEISKMTDANELAVILDSAPHDGEIGKKALERLRELASNGDENAKQMLQCLLFKNYPTTEYLRDNFERLMKIFPPPGPLSD